jgi:hypothetical protein
VTAASINGLVVVKAFVTLPSSGVWTADVWLPADGDLSGAVTLKIAGLTLVGTVVRGGSYAGSAAYRIVGGAGGWRKSLEPKVYRNDQGVKLSLVLGDLARETGETVSLGTDASLGPAFVRRRAEASRVLREVVPGGWWVAPDGTTQIRPRVSSAVDPKTYQVVNYEPLTGIANIATEEPERFVPGCAIAIPKGPTVTAKLVRIHLDKSALRVQAWPADDVLGGLEPLVRAQLPLTDFHAFYEYLVAGQSGDRLDLRPGLSGLGLPDLPGFLPRPGAAGTKATLQPGSRVLVGFANGDPSRPFAAFYEPPGGGGFLPVSASLDASDDVEIGGSADMVHLGSGSETPYTPGAEVGRVLRWGDVVAGPASLGAPLVLAPAVPGASPIAKVRADGL